MPPNFEFADGQKSLRVAIIGQSQFAADVFELLQDDGHCIVGVFTIPDKGSREDALAKIARANNVPVFKIKAWRKAGKALPEILDMYQSVNAELNVLPYCSQFIPMEVITYPKYESIVYHPSILPKHRGASSINWTLMCGDKEAGFSIFWADDGLDTGPVLLQEKCALGPNETVDEIYNRFLYPNGVEAVASAVNMVADGSAPRIVQSTDGATYEPILNKPQPIDWSVSALALHNFIRGLDSVPGALCRLNPASYNEPQDVLLFGSKLWSDPLPPNAVAVKSADSSAAKAYLHENGLILVAGDGKYVNVERIKINGKMKLAAKLNETVQQTQLVYTVDEQAIVDGIRTIWCSIFNAGEIEDDCDFFEMGAGSMDVVRLVEEIKDAFAVELENTHVFMAPQFSELAACVIQTRRGASASGGEIEYRAVEMRANNRDIKFPCQLFINGEFVDAEGGRTIPTVNPANEEVICNVQCASRGDVDKAVNAAHNAFTNGEWRMMSARERGQLLYRLADLMHTHREELATIESIDSGAVYTLALKTHIGMSVETWRYYAGWCDKIQGRTIPISNARPNKNFTYTRREPIGVVGLITPWNYPLMMLSWKMAACLAAGNTVVIKPAQVTPLTALKFAELSARAGIPPGVINVVAGKGSEAGDYLAAHPLVRKLGFTGSTEIGKVIMRTCATSNVKKASLELGGKSPLIICADCDMDKAVRVGMQSVFFNKGENCIAAGRLFVEASIHDRFVKRVVSETRKMKIGDPLDRSTAHGPQNHLTHLEKLLEYVERGVKEGAKLVYGGKRLPRSGYFLQPTIFTNVTDDMYIAQEESFGPIMIISKFNDGDIDGALRRANATEYGLASGVFTRDLSKALSIVERLDAGTVFVNTYNKTDVGAPFGGFKQSGFGKDLGEEALNEYLKTKCVTVEY